MENTRQHRRGLSTVIGAVFMILVTIGALNVVLWTLQQQNTVNQSIIEKTSSNLNKLNEEVEISNVKVTDANKLNMTLTNSGGAAATLKSIYIVNETASEQYRYDLDLVVDGRESENVGEDLPFIVASDARYSIRLVTASGNTVTTTLTPLSSVALPMQLYVIPPTVTPGNNVTLLFAVINNLTDSTLAADITPTLTVTPDCTPGPGCGLTGHVTPSGGMPLTKGNTVLFKWVYEVNVPDETYITFTASLVGAKPGNSVTEKAYAKLVEESQTSSSSETVIFSSLVQRPEIFLIMPGPFGDTGSEIGPWGVVVVNPTEVDMEVTRIVIGMFTAGESTSQKIVDANCNDSDNPIWPNVDGEWSCPGPNKIQWKRLAGEAIEPYGVRSFLNRLEPKGLSDDEQAFITSATVFTNMGQFTKTGYASGMSKTADSLISTYLTTTSTETDARLEQYIHGNMSNIESGSQVTVRIAISDFDSSSSTKIKPGARLVINIPKDFENVQVSNHAQFTEEVIEYDDGAKQIVATLDSPEYIGDNGSGESKIITFTADVPTVTKTKTYIMYTLLDGETNANFPVTAFAEIALHVVP